MENNMENLNNTLEMQVGFAEKVKSAIDMEIGKNQSSLSDPDLTDEAERVSLRARLDVLKSYQLIVAKGLEELSSEKSTELMKNIDSIWDDLSGNELKQAA
jgi:hypothetical protein